MARAHPEHGYKLKEADTTALLPKHATISNT